MAEGARLESVWAGNRLVGSNPTPSANALAGVCWSIQPKVNFNLQTQPNVRARMILLFCGRSARP